MNIKMTDMEKVTEKVAEQIYHFVHRGHARYFTWEKLPDKYGKKQYREIAEQIIPIIRKELEDEMRVKSHYVDPVIVYDLHHPHHRKRPLVK